MNETLLGYQELLWAETHTARKRIKDFFRKGGISDTTRRTSNLACSSFDISQMQTLYQDIRAIGLRHFIQSPDGAKLLHPENAVLFAAMQGAVAETLCQQHIVNNRFGLIDHHQSYEVMSKVIREQRFREFQKGRFDYFSYSSGLSLYTLGDAAMIKKPSHIDDQSVLENLYEFKGRIPRNITFRERVSALKRTYSHRDILPFIKDVYCRSADFPINNLVIAPIEDLKINLVVCTPPEDDQMEQLTRQFNKVIHLQIPQVKNITYAALAVMTRNVRLDTVIHNLKMD